jgi:hypothetical protein
VKTLDRKKSKYSMRRRTKRLEIINHERKIIMASARCGVITYAQAAKEIEELIIRLNKETD